MRRREMYSKPSTGAWDFEWDCSSGISPVDLGFEVSSSGSVLSSFIVDEGYHMRCYGIEDYVYLTFSQIPTSEKSIAEYKFYVPWFSNYEGAGFNLSNGSVSLQVFMRSSGFYFNGINSANKIYDAESNVIYTLRTEFDSENGCKVYINGNLISESSGFSGGGRWGAIVKHNTVSCRCSNALLYLQSVKYKFGG